MLSSIKKIWWSSYVVSGVIWASQSSFSAKFDTRVGIGRSQITSHRNRFLLEQRLTATPLHLLGSIRAQTEGIAQTGRSEVTFRDLYAQGRFDPWQIKVGYQQVVWGEAFGFYFADLINPKDLTELGLGDLEGNRLTVALVNVRYVDSGFSAQGIFIPYPSISRVATQGAYAFPFADVLGRSADVSNETRPPHAFPEAGLRVAFPVGSLSFAAFGFSGLDREPPFQSQDNQVDRPFYRMTTVGLTTSFDLGSSVLRSELLYQFGKKHAVILPLQLTHAQADQWTAVIGYDIPVKDWQVGLQVSTNLRTRDIPAQLADKQPQIAARVAGTSVPEWELIVSYLPSDGSTLLQPRIGFALSRELDLVIGGEFFMGGKSSVFGQYEQASRLTLQIRAFLKS